MVSDVVVRAERLHYLNAFGAWLVSAAGKYVACKAIAFGELAELSESALIVYLH